MRKAALRILSGVLTLGLLTLTTACGTTTKESEKDDKLNLVATTTMLADLAQVIGGDAITTTGLMGVGVDPHLYKASAGDVTTLEKADIILYNGIHLEGQMTDVFDQLTAMDKVVISAQEALDIEDLLSWEEEDYAYDPHIWFDISLWEKVAIYLADTLVTMDPNNRATYEENLLSYLEELKQLEKVTLERIEEIPEESRIIVTAHDAFNYLGNAYGFQVLGLQGISTDSEASTSDISELASFIVEHEIKAIFVETSVPTKNIEALQEAVNAKGFQVIIGGELYSDSLGDISAGHETYISTFDANINTIVDALK